MEGRRLIAFEIPLSFFLCVPGRIYREPAFTFFFAPFGGCQRNADTSEERGKIKEACSTLSFFSSG